MCYHWVAYGHHLKWRWKIGTLVCKAKQWIGCVSARRVRALSHWSHSANCWTLMRHNSKVRVHTVYEMAEHGIDTTRIYHRLLQSACPCTHVLLSLSLRWFHSTYSTENITLVNYIVRSWFSTRAIWTKENVSIENDFQTKWARKKQNKARHSFSSNAKKSGIQILCSHCKVYRKNFRCQR